jgi:hypothetical protein
VYLKTKKKKKERKEKKKGVGLGGWLHPTPFGGPPPLAKPGSAKSLLILCLSPVERVQTKKGM